MQRRGNRKNEYPAHRVAHLIVSADPRALSALTWKVDTAVNSRLREGRKWLLVILATACMTPAKADPPGAYGPELEGFEYSFTVERFSFSSQGRTVSMIFMDVAPNKPNGRTVVLLHGKNFCAATWDETIKA